MDEPLISVIVPVYMAEKYLKRCVDSICSQTHRNLEIILIDDGSPDGSGDLCDEIAALDSRVCVCHTPNSGQAAARNCGLNMASGEYIAFVDSDDYIAQDMYTTMLELMEHNDAQIVCCGIERVTDSGHLSYFNENTEDLLILNTSQALRELVFNYRVTSSPCDKLFHRSIFEENRMRSGMIYEDYEIMHRCIFLAERVVYTGKPMYCYYQSPDSTLRKKYSAKHFDAMTAERMRFQFYQHHCQENLDVESAQYLKTGLNILGQSRGVKECAQLRADLRRDLLKFVKQYDCEEISSYIRVRVNVLRFGLVIYDLILAVAACKQRLLRALKER